MGVHAAPIVEGFVCLVGENQLRLVLFSYAVVHSTPVSGVFLRRGAKGGKETYTGTNFHRLLTSTLIYTHNKNWILREGRSSILISVFVCFLNH